MTERIYTAEVLVKANTSSLKSSVTSLGTYLTGTMGSIGSKAGAAFSSAFTTGVTGGLAILAGGAGLAAWTTKLASDAEEAASKFSFVFGDAARETGEKLDTFAVAAGRSRVEMRSMAADVGALIGPMGFSAQRTGELSNQVAQLAVDLSSFFNVSEADALTALRAGLVGESEPLRRLGVQLNEGKIQAEAFAKGLAKTKDEVTGAVKAESILSIVMRETATAQGDAIRTAGSFANTLRALKGTLHDLGVSVGKIFLPAATATIGFMRKIAQSAEENGAVFVRWGEQLKEIVENLLAIVTNVGGQIAAAIQSGFGSLISDATGGAATSFTEFVTKALDAAAILTSDLEGTWQLIKIGAKLAFNEMGIYFVGQLNAMKSVGMGFFEGLTSVGEGAFEAIGSAIEVMGLDFAGVMSGMVAAATSGFRQIMNKAKPLSFLAPNLSTAFDAAMKLAESTDPEATLKAFQDAQKTVGDQTKSKRDALGSTIGGLVDRFAGGMSRGFEKGQTQNDVVNRLLGNLKGSRGSLLDQFRAKFQDMAADRFAKQFRDAPEEFNVEMKPEAAKKSTWLSKLMADMKLSQKDADAIAKKKAEDSNPFRMLGGLVGGLAGGGGKAVAMGADMIGAGMAGLADERPQARAQFVGLTDFSKRIQESLGGTNKEAKRDRLAERQAKHLDDIKRAGGNAVVIAKQQLDALKNLKLGFMK